MARTFPRRGEVQNCLRGPVAGGTSFESAIILFLHGTALFCYRVALLWHPEKKSGARRGFR